MMARSHCVGDPFARERGSPPPSPSLRKESLVLGARSLPGAADTVDQGIPMTFYQNTVPAHLSEPRPSFLNGRSRRQRTESISLCASHLLPKPPALSIPRSPVGSTHARHVIEHRYTTGAGAGAGTGTGTGHAQVQMARPLALGGIQQQMTAAAAAAAATAPTSGSFLVPSQRPASFPPSLPSPLFIIIVYLFCFVFEFLSKGTSGIRIPWPRKLGCSSAVHSLSDLLCPPHPTSATPPGFMSVLPFHPPHHTPLLRTKTTAPKLV
ncbi:hypothetical protein LZ31DRAFT_132143 [Colletotrichum somersetense]|nr:hypothetical protein LZ31DRAFT_132143 [Colletotrichum somersetense]